jgi:hypothetical protein
VRNIFVSVGIYARNSITASMIQFVYSSLAKGFDFFSSVETRLRNSVMTL